MKKPLSIILATLLLAVACTAKQSRPETGAADSDATPEKRVLVAYFSCTGTTEAAAKAIAGMAGADIYRITPAREYTAADLDWRDKSSRASVEMSNTKSRPELAPPAAAIANYDVIFVGYPIWGNTCPAIINTFMESANFDGKTVIPFATSGSSTIDNSEQALRKLYGAGITWRAGKLIDAPEAGEVAEWVRSNIR